MSKRPIEYDDGYYFATIEGWVYTIEIRGDCVVTIDGVMLDDGEPSVARFLKREPTCVIGKQVPR